MPTLGAALAAQVRFAGAKLPLWGILLSTVVPVLCAAGLALLLMSSPQASTSMTAVGSAQATEPEAPAAPLAQAAGEPSEATLKALEARQADTLSTKELLTLAQGRSSRDLAAVRAVRDELARQPDGAKDRATLGKLRDFANNPLTAPDALAAMAALPGPLSADLLYEIWTGTAARTDTTELARALVYSADVRSKASPALAAALELRAAETCEANKAALGHVTKDGDRRALPALLKLKRKQGCGPNKKQDCFACLREGDELEDANKALKGRKAPNPFGAP